MTNKIYMAVGAVAGFLFLVFAGVDFSAGDTDAGQNDIIYAIIGFAASGLLFYLDRRQKQRGAGARGR
ncbi:hypothetical protein AB0I53_26995 [Saccharopolyspora sp. NPDC050389]|uniref:hypothetical protein n=1 Tax=Saccharopolyspora sp. NPDC050389 TaxID=3155516 RepID=UPI0033D029EB